MEAALIELARGQPDEVNMGTLEEVAVGGSADMEVDSREEKETNLVALLQRTRILVDDRSLFLTSVGSHIHKARICSTYIDRRERLPQRHRLFRVFSSSSSSSLPPPPPSRTTLDSEETVLVSDVVATLFLTKQGSIHLSLVEIKGLIVGGVPRNSIPRSLLQSRGTVVVGQPMSLRLAFSEAREDGIVEQEEEDVEEAFEWDHGFTSTSTSSIDGSLVLLVPLVLQDAFLSLPPLLNGEPLPLRRTTYRFARHELEALVQRLDNRIRIAQAASSSPKITMFGSVPGFPYSTPNGQFLLLTLSRTSRS